MSSENINPKRGLPPRPHEMAPPPPHLMALTDDWPERFRSKVQLGDGKKMEAQDHAA